jgi:hypothetical protein
MSLRVRRRLLNSGTGTMSMVRFEQHDRQLSAGPDLDRIGCERPNLVGT